MDKYKKLEDMEAKKWISKYCTHLDNTRQEIGLYELCLVMEEYHKHKLNQAQRAKKNNDVR